MASAANEVGLYRSPVGVGGGGGITPAKVNSGSASAQFVVYTTWSSSQPTLGDLLWRFSMNANGGIDKLLGRGEHLTRIVKGGKPRRIAPKEDVLALMPELCSKE